MLSVFGHFVVWILGPEINQNYFPATSVAHSGCDLDLRPASRALPRLCLGFPRLGQVRSGLLLPRPKSRTMRATRQLFATSEVTSLESKYARIIEMIQQSQPQTSRKTTTMCCKQPKFLLIRGSPRDDFFNCARAGTFPGCAWAFRVGVLCTVEARTMMQHRGQYATVAHLARLEDLQAAAEARTLKLRRGAARLGGR